MHDRVPVLLPCGVTNEADEVPTVLNTITGTIYLTNEVGMTIIQLCDASRSVAEIAGIITEKYSIDMTRSMTDVQEFLRDAVEVGIVCLES